MDNTTTSVTGLGDEVVITTTHEWEDGKTGDSRIKLGEHQLCWVSGAEYEELIIKLQNLVNEYRI